MRLIRTLLVVGGLTQSQLALAQNIERARELFEEASSLREAGMYEAAIVRLRQAIAIKDTPGLEYHAGFCESKLGHYRLAIKYYEHAAALLREGATAPDVVTLLPLAHAAALEHLARVRIGVSDGSSATRLRLDDEAEQAVPEGDLLLDAGKHRVVISAAGFRPEERHITVTPGESLKIDIRLRPLDTEVYARMSSPPGAFPWHTVSIGTGLGVTAVGLGIAIVSTVQRNDAENRIKIYGGSATQLSKAQSDKDSAMRWETIGFVSAGVGAVATLALWTLWPSSQHVAVAVDTGGPSMTSSRVMVVTAF